VTAYIFSFFIILAVFLGAATAGPPPHAAASTNCSVEVRVNKLIAHRQNKGKGESREYPLMFDIAEKSKKHKAEKSGKK
jgi:hypothetical protein